jgi:crotonobetainyl-CoA:carnitine CoA-transferase CaiB-like acyl-CoA transferase
MPGALEGLRVVDLSSQTSGPYCTMMLGDQGADVIKIEQPGKPDNARLIPPFINESSVAFATWNRNKRAMTLDVKAPADREVLFRLLATTDILVENFKPGAMERQGLGFDDLHKSFPRLIYGKISGFGNSGPYRALPGYDMIAQAMSGLMAITGPKDGPPHRLPIALSDVAAGMFLAFGILAAVQARHRTGRGQFVETSLLETALAFQNHEAVHYFTKGENPPRMGQGHRGASPYGVVRTSDGHMTINADRQDQYQQFCEIIGSPQLAHDPRFGNTALRVANNETLMSLIEQRMISNTRAYWLEKFQSAGIAAGPVLEHHEIFNDPHVLERGMVTEIDHPQIGRMRTLGVPLKMSDTPPGLRRAAPLPGEHDAEIRAELAGNGPVR